MDRILPDDILKQIYSPSKIQHLLELTLRLKDDIADLEVPCIKIKIYFKRVKTKWYFSQQNTYWRHDPD